MATVDMTSGTAGFVSGAPYSARPYVAEIEVDFAAATTAKGSALAAADIIQALDIPAGSMVLAAWMEVVTAMTGTATNLALDLGITGVDVDAFVDGFDYDGASVGDISAVVAYGTGTKPVVTASDDTLDVLIQAQTGTFTGGKIRVRALIIDVNGKAAPGVAAAGS